MEKNEFYVEFADKVPASYGHGTRPGICYLAYGKGGYYLTPFRQELYHFASEEDAKEACLHLAPTSGALKDPFSSVIVRKGESAVYRVTKFRALPGGKECPTPQALAATRKQFADGPNRPADFASHEKEHENMKLPEMEQSLIAEFKARCELGFKQYGPVYLAKRNWGKEMKEEALDGLFYTLMAAKTVEKYGAFIQALEEASDDELSMDACSPDPLKQAAYLVKKYAADLSAMEKDFSQVNGMFEHLDKTVIPAYAAEAAELRKALEDEREAKRIAARDADATIAGLCESRDTHLQNSEALMKELVESRKSGAAEFLRAQKAENDAQLESATALAALHLIGSVRAALRRALDGTDGSERAISIMEDILFPEGAS